MPRLFRYMICTLSGLFLLSGCKKFLEVDPPISTITTEEMFTTNKQAELAVNGIYTKMIHSVDALNPAGSATRSFAAGLSTIMGSLSSDDFFTSGAIGDINVIVNQNKLSVRNTGGSGELWDSGFKTIYDANAVIEGLQSDAARNLTDSVRNQLLGEVLTIRAFSYFYLVNFFGELPVVVTTDFNKTNKLSRSPVSKIYDLIKTDLLNALPLLAADFSVGKGERVRINKWFVEALLARVYLYTKEYSEAITHATNVISQTSMFSIEPNVANVFLSGSKEAIFQLKPNNENPQLRNATPEGYRLSSLGFPSATLPSPYSLSNELLNAFEAGDNRKASWTSPYASLFTSAKYKISQYNSVVRGPQNEYYVVMRLAELYLIRAEAIALGEPGNKDNAIDDINVLRRRADVDELSKSLTAEQVVEAVAKERQLELFAEWGHRWFDLKRTGKASQVLSQIAAKQPWVGDFQLLYPIPVQEIQFNSFLLQNPEYNNY
ncbi:MAG: RagB/SusD family nutrient uptake outer membrane protein [Pseudobacter sp.]|uniref:RagB/SusD family nutrient uptake outer membrane protein n=1 Tax=Pseudobacter sp. TaxID=2045420 RepID=UPI003F81F732